MENNDPYKGCKGCCVFDLDCPIVECRQKVGKHFDCLCAECIVKCMCAEACTKWLDEMNECKNLIIAHAKTKHKEKHEKIKKYIRELL